MNTHKHFLEYKAQVYLVSSLLPVVGSHVHIVHSCSLQKCTLCQVEWEHMCGSGQGPPDSQESPIVQSQHLNTSYNSLSCLNKTQNTFQSFMFQTIYWSHTYIHQIYHLDTLKHHALIKGTLHLKNERSDTHAHMLNIFAIGKHPDWGGHILKYPYSSTTLVGLYRTHTKLIYIQHCSV